MKTRRIFFVVFPEFELLDLSGAVSVFSTASSLHPHTPYQTNVISTPGGLITSSAGITVDSQTFDDLDVGADDSVLVVGGIESAIRNACLDTKLISWLQKIHEQTERIGSICSGAFVLAASGLLDGKKCTSHWAATHLLKKNWAKVEVQQDALYVNDGKIWTSAGVTTGIDMALELTRIDCGKDLSNKVAKMLVVYAHRPGNQSQFSSLLSLQRNTTSQFSNLLAWIDNNIDKAPRVQDLADYMAMTERTFYRKFTSTFKVTPSKYMEDVKFERAQRMLEDSCSINSVARAIGFRSESAFRTRFEKHFGMTPSMHQKLHRK